jgi:NAD(P)-dependent dehydrogenase (short-subunit alcohol dehydrogenase family)
MSIHVQKTYYFSSRKNNFPQFSVIFHFILLMSEESTQNSKRFSGKVVLITGATGNVGSGFLRAFLNLGAIVVAPSRSKESLDSIIKYTKGHEGRYYPLVENISSEKGAESVKKFITEKFGKVDHVVSSLGAWIQKGPLTKQPVENFNAAIFDLATCHFILAKTFLPFISKQKGSTYTMITGGAGGGFPNPDASLTVIGAATLWGVSAALRTEFEKAEALVNEYRISIRVVKEEDVKQKWENSHFLVGEAFVNTIQHIVSKEIRGQILTLKNAEELEQQRKLF